jgi:hypothetical protein
VMGRGASASSSGGISFGSHRSQPRHPARQLRTVRWTGIQDVSGFWTVSVNAGAGGVNVAPAARQREDKNDVEARKAPRVGSAGPETWSAGCAAEAHPRPGFRQRVIVR